MANSMLMPLSFERQYGASLDADYEFATIDELRDYATGSPLSYAGQILYCKADDALYKVNATKTDIDPVGEGGGGGAKTYTSLAQLGLTADATLNDAIAAMSLGSSALLGVTEFTDYQTIFPYTEGNDQFGRVFIEKGNDTGRTYVKWFRKDGKKEALGVMNINNNQIEGWNLNPFTNVYTTLAELGLTADATINDVKNALKVGGSCMIRTDAFTDLTQFNNIQYGYLKITSTVNGLCDIWLNDVTAFGNRLYYGRQASGQFAEWIAVSTQKTYTTLAELGLTADATIDDVVTALPDGGTAMITTNEFTDYLTMFPDFCANDRYAILQVEKENGNRAFIEWRQKEGDAYAIGGLNSNNKFTDWGNIFRFKKDGYADDSIVCIGDTVSADGVIQSLASLGFTTDVMTWDTGVYRVSHVSGLTNLPSDIVSTAPGFRLEHYDCKKWGANHNPNKSTWAIRHSVLYAESGNIYHRYTESGATAGVYAKDTGWQKIQTTGSNVTLVTNTQTLKLDVTKKNSSWYGAIKLTYLYDTSPVEVEISFRSATDDVRWAVINGQKYINKITYTQDSANTAHYTIGVEFAGTTYGCYQVDVIGDFAVVNSLTKDAFTGDKTAVYNAPWGKNNGVSLVSAPEDLGLTFPCTTVQLVQAMRNKFNKTITSSAIGVFNNGGKTVCITDAPSDYGLLHIECFGHDRLMVRYEGIGDSTYAGSWIGKIKGSNGTFSGITWENIDPSTSNIYKTYGGIGELNSAKGTSITLESNVDNTQKIIDALGAREEFVEWYGNSNNRFGLAPATYGDRINYLRIVKINSNNAIILAATSSGIVASRTYADGTLGDWCVQNQQGGSGIYLPTTSGAKMNIKFTRLNLNQSIPMRLTYYLNGSFNTAEFYVNTMSISYNTNDPRTILDARHDISSATQAECNMYIEFSGAPSLLMLTVPPEFGVVTSFATGTTVHSKYVISNETIVNFGTLETASSAITKYSNIKGGYVVRNGVCYFGLTIHTESGYVKGTNYLLVDGLPASIFEYCAASIRIWGNVDIDSTYQSSAYVQNGELRVLLNIESGKAATISIFGSYPVPYA